MKEVYTDLSVNCVTGSGQSRSHDTESVPHWVGSRTETRLCYHLM